MSGTDQAVLLRENGLVDRVVLRAHLSNPSNVFLALLPGVIEARLLPPAPAPALPGRVRTFRPSVEQQLLIVGRYEGGATMAEIAAELDCSRKRIMRVLHEAGVSTSRPSLRPDQLEDICALYREGWSLAEIGRKYGCAHTTVRDFMITNGVGLRPRRGWLYN